MGKASFCNIQDLKGNIQVYVQEMQIGEETYADFKKSDIGDILVSRDWPSDKDRRDFYPCIRNDTLSKSLTDPSGEVPRLTDTDVRYRQRYVDLIMNPESKETFIKRSKIIKEIRSSLKAGISWKLRLQCLYKCRWCCSKTI